MKPQMDADGRRQGQTIDHGLKTMDSGVPSPKSKVQCLSAGMNRRASAVAPTVFRVTDRDKEQFFHICPDDKVRLENVKFLNLTRDMLFVCRDVALDDETAANLALHAG